MLQWGRNLTVAEGPKLKPEELLEDALQWGRNLTVAEGFRPMSVVDPGLSFNGAAT